MANNFLCGRFEFDLERPLVMGIVNVTPDSFSDGGQHDDTDSAVAYARQLIEEGAQILDLGGESTRPGADPVSVADELNRLLPVVEALRDCGVPLSIDTFKPEVMRATLDAGADMINDIYGFRQPGAIEAVSQSRCGLCVMHMKGEPRTMQAAPPEYTDLIGEIGLFLGARAKAARGLDRSSPHRAGPGFRVWQDGRPELSTAAPAVQPAQYRLSIADRPVAQKYDRPGHRPAGWRPAARQHCRRACLRRAWRLHRARARCCGHGGCA